MKKSSQFMIGIFLFFLFMATSCGQDLNLPEENGNDATEPLQTVEPFYPETEEELRQAIGQAGDGKEALEAKREYYEMLFSMDVFEEADYVALAQVYANLNEWSLQRNMLSKVLRLYPSVEYAEQLSNIVILADGTDDKMAALADCIMDALVQRNTIALQELSGQEEWKEILQQGMTGIETRTRYCEGENILQITADGSYTEITWLGADGKFCFYEGDETGAVLGEAYLADGIYNGNATVLYSDSAGNALRVYNTVLQGGVCTEQIAITHQGKEYIGKLNPDGTTAEEQYKTVAEQEGVLYAYTEDGKSYLYQENASPETFRLDAAYLGFPEYTDWSRE